MSQTPENSTDFLLTHLADGLETTAKLTQTLLSDLKESEIDFAEVKTELNILKENVKGLTTMIRDGSNGSTSLVTRVALIEQNIENIKNWLDNHVDVHQRVKIEINKLHEQINTLDKRVAILEDRIK